jgi:hypothetical protein
MVVAPVAPRPASRIADLTCALAIGTWYSMPRSADEPVMRSGAVTRGPWPTTDEPMRLNGWATRSIGRRESDASPTSAWPPGTALTTPASNRMVVPELPQSRARSLAWRPSAGPTTMVASPSSIWVAPSWTMMRPVEATSRPGESPAMVLSPLARALNISARCEALLSPGTLRQPRRVGAGTTRVTSLTAREPPGSRGRSTRG